MQRYIAFGDIHGMFDEFERLFNKIPKEETDILVFIGDYVDRGPKNKHVIDFLMNLPVSNKAVFLRGNHEDMIIQSLIHSNFDLCWRQNGGMETLRDFGIVASGQFEQKYMDFFKATELFYQPEGANLLFVHAGVNPLFPLNEQHPFDIMWIRDDFLNSTKDFGPKIVHGHTPHMRGIDIRPNRINVDTGSCFGGAVSAVVLDEAGNVLEQYSEKCSKP